MTVTIRLADSLNNLLEQRATKLKISVEDLATKLLSDALLAEWAEQSFPVIDDDFPTLDEIVARIKALPPNPKSFHPAKKAFDQEYIAWLLENPTPGTMTVEEWKEFWPQFERELKELDRKADVLEGRI